VCNYHLKLCETPSQWKKTGIVAHACHPSNGGKHKNRRITVQANLGKKQEPISKIIRVKRAGDVA
jgi:hypothetical protein